MNEPREEVCACCGSTESPHFECFRCGALLCGDCHGDCPFCEEEEGCCRLRG